MKCPRCQAENRPQAKFCEECGTTLARTCANCGTQLSATAKFCAECGHAVAGATAVQERFASPETYTPKHLAEKILTSKSALEGERKQVTVLFADLKGSMELLADRDPEEARKLLDPVLERMMEAVHRYEGTVNQVMGDGIMALFGAPLAHEDHAVRACYAALRMQESVKRYADEVQRREGLPVNIRVGLNSGEVVVRAIGSDLHMDYTAVGQTTHLAARMEQMAQPGSILVTGDGLRLAEGYVQVKPMGPVQAKGLSEPVEVYEVTGAGPVRRRLEAAVARGLTRFVGRDAELDQLRKALDQAAQGHGQVVAVVGEPGVGKSRLFYEFTHSHRTHGWLILESGSVSYGKATTYLPIIDLLKVYFQIEARDDARKIREKVMGKLLALDEAFRPMLAAFLSLLDVPVEDPHWQAFDPLQRRQRTLEAVKRLLLRESQVQSLCLIFEDLHWVDSETQAVLDSLIESLPTARLLLLVNYRPEYQHGWGSKTYYTQLRIDPLPPESAEQLLDALLGPDPGLRALKHLLIERTEGNPLFLEESVRNLVETHVLSGERGAYCLMRDVTTIQVAPTVQAVLAARIDRLPPDHKRLLQSASVIGETVPLALLRAVTDLPEDDLRARLADLQAAEYLYEASLFPDLEYTFKHGLTYQVAYNSVLTERRRTLHTRIVDAIEGLYPDRLAEQAERLAHHASRGEVWDKALAYVHQAGVKALERAAHRESVSWLEQGLLALDKLPRVTDNLARGVDVRIALRYALFPLRERRRSLEYLREAEELAKVLADRPRLGRVLTLVASELWFRGDHRDGLEAGHRAHEIASQVGDIDYELQSRFRLGQLYYSMGDYACAVEALARNIESLTGDRLYQHFGFPAPLSAMSRLWIGWAHGERGEFADAMRLSQEAVAIAEADKNAYGLAHGCFGEGLMLIWKGEFERAMAVLERGREVSAANDFPVLFCISTLMLGYARALARDPAGGLALIDTSLAEADAIEMLFDQPIWLAWRGEALLLDGRPEEAERVALEALALARSREQRGQEAWALRLLGEIATRSAARDHVGAQEWYREAAARARHLGMRPLLAHCHLGLGKLCRRTGDRSKAQEHLTTANAMLREMDMRFWLEQAEAELKALESKGTKKARRRT